MQETILTIYSYLLPYIKQHPLSINTRMKNKIDNSKNHLLEKKIELVTLPEISYKTYTYNFSEKLNYIIEKRITSL